jgi:hypothetical protein
MAVWNIPMCTLIVGEGSQAGLNGVMAHEVTHSWYQMALASNESLYAWMDEGFTDFASEEAMNTIFNEPLIMQEVIAAILV